MTTSAIRSGNALPLRTGVFALRLLGNGGGWIQILVQSWLLLSFHAVKLDLLLTDGEVAVIKFLRHRVETVTEIEVDERSAFSSFVLVKSGRFLEVAAQIGELFVVPNLLDAEGIAFFRVPHIVEVQCDRDTGCDTSLPFVSSTFSSASLSGFSRNRFLLSLLELCCRDEDRQFRQPVLRSLIARQ